MKKKLNCILLVDDDSNCNFFHKRLLTKKQCAEKIEIALNGQDAISFLLKQVDGNYHAPAIIFLDINMPGMNGWEFLEEYEKLDNNVKAKVVVVMLTTSINPDDEKKAVENKNIKGFQRKYLDEEALDSILAEHFPDYL
jgi:CheY-like chemotaxis protein